MARYALAAILIVLFSAGCRDPGSSEYRFTRFSMGTVVEYTIIASDEASARAAVRRAHNEMERVSRLLWEGDSLSVLSAFNRVEDRLDVPTEVGDFLKRIHELATLTGGAFDPTVKPVISLYDFDSPDPRPPDDDALAAALALVGIDGLHLDPDGYASKDRPALALAAGAVAKGYAVDRAVAALSDAGIDHAIVNAGGDLYCLGSRDGKPWRVGVRHPDDPAEVVVVFRVTDAAVATSGDYQQFFEHAGTRYHHIVDPVTGRPARGVRSATVVAATAERADALATALFVRGAAEGLDMIASVAEAEGLVIDSSGLIQSTPGMDEYLAGATDRGDDAE